MEDALRAQANLSSDRAPSATGAQLPLAMVAEGECVTVSRLRGGQEMKRHLAELGFVEGAEVMVVSRVGGDVIVSVKGANFGLDRQMAMKVVTA